jgi:hypothetical protein
LKVPGCFKAHTVCVHLCSAGDFTDEHWLRYIAGAEKVKEGRGADVLVRTNEGSKYRLMMLSPVSPHCDVTKVISPSLVHAFLSLFLP